MEALKPKPAKKKVLLMGKSGSGKSSMRSIIFSNYVAKDVRRLGATIDVEHSQIKFLGNLVLNLWDCGGQDAFTETYLSTQTPQIFTTVGVLIYVFDVESRSFLTRDLQTYASILQALHHYSPDAKIFTLVHKMDLVQESLRPRVLDEKTSAIESRSGVFQKRVRVYGTSIWDQSLYQAWGRIVHELVPDLSSIESYLSILARETSAEEIVLFERATFLTVTSVVGPAGSGNPYDDRFERLSNVIKTFKHSLGTYTHASSSSHPFSEICVKTSRFNLVLSRLTPNTYVLVVIPPGEAEIECTRLNIMDARDAFERLDGLGGRGRRGGEDG